jgi:formate hydrogenlyase subunit 6/NADH:ubiquinone oxidoreductase subunit I
MYLPKLREIKEALTSFFTAPYTTKFPVTPYQPEDEYRGFPKYNPEYCIGCGTCAQVCPTNAIKVYDDKITATRKLEVEYLSCIHCGQCNEKCITGQGIAPSLEYALPVFDTKAPEVFESIEQELVICECCDEIIACKNHLSWIKDRLGAKAYAHPNFMLLTQEKFFGLEVSRPKERVRREDYMKYVCARCRHKIVVADEF